MIYYWFLEKVGIDILKNSKGIYWLVANDWRCLWKLRRPSSNKEKESVNSVWLYDSRHGI